MSRDLAECLASIGSRLRVKSPCHEKNRARAAAAVGIDLADLLANSSDAEFNSTTPLHKVSVVPQLPMPAGGFCRRSAAVQWALAQEMSRHAEYKFDFGEEEWPTLLDAMDNEEFGFDFEFVECEDEEEDDFVLEMLAGEEGDDNLDGEWACLLISATAEANAKGSGATVQGIAAAASALELDFRKAIRLQRVPMMPRLSPDVAASAKTGESGEEWPTLTGGPAAPLSASPNSVCIADIAGQWVSVVEKSKEPRMPAEDKKSRNFRDVCRRTAAQIRRAEKKMILKAQQQPAEDFPALPGVLEL